METSKMREKCIYISYTEMSDSVQEFTDDVRMTQDLAVDGNITANGFFVDAARKRIIQTNPVIVANNITAISGQTIVRDINVTGNFSMAKKANFIDGASFGGNVDSKAIHTVQIGIVDNGYLTVRGNTGLGTTAPRTILDISSTDAVQMPAGTSAERPVNPTNGYIRYNTDTNAFEGYADGTWAQLGGILNASQETNIVAGGVGNNELQFFTQSVKRAYIDSSGDLFAENNFVLAKDGTIHGVLNTNSIIADGDVSLNSGLTVGGVSTFKSGATFENDITILGQLNAPNLTFGGDLSVTGDLEAGLLTANRITTTGVSTINGATTFNAPVTFNSATGTTFDLNVGQNLNVTGNAALNNVSSSGTATLNNATITNLNATSDASFGQNVYIDDNLTVNGKLFVREQQTENVLTSNTTIHNINVTEDLSVNGNLAVADDSSFNGNLYIEKDLQVDKTLNVVESASIPKITSDILMEKTTTLSGEVLAKSNMIAEKDIIIKSALHSKHVDISENLVIGSVELTTDGINSDIIMKKSTTLSGELIAKSDATFEAPVHVQSVLDVQGDAIINQNAIIHQNATVNGNMSAQTLTAIGDAQLNSNLSVMGTTTLQGQTTAQEKLVAMKDMSLNSTLVVAKDTTLNSGLAVTGPATFVSTITSTGDINANANLTVAQTTTTNNLSATTATIDTATINNTLLVKQAATLEGDVTIKGDTTMDNKLAVNDHVTINANLNVLNSSQLRDVTTTSTLVVGGNATMNEKLTVKDDFTAERDVDITGDTTMGGFSHRICWRYCIRWGIICNRRSNRNCKRGCFWNTLCWWRNHYAKHPTSQRERNIY